MTMDIREDFRNQCFYHCANHSAYKPINRNNNVKDKKGNGQILIKKRLSFCLEKSVILIRNGRFFY